MPIVSVLIESVAKAPAETRVAFASEFLPGSGIASRTYCVDYIRNIIRDEGDGEFVVILRPVVEIGGQSA